jgi:hypothetical protein
MTAPTDSAARARAPQRSRFAALGLLAALAFGAVGCAVNDADLVRWETTLGGPKRLSAVVLHDKYPHPLRVQAAMSLVRMKPRKGKHVGIERLVKGTLVCDTEFIKEGEPCKTAQLTPEARGKILADLVPLIIAELQKPAPPAQAGQPQADPSFRFKDAAYLMLTYEKTQVVADPALRKQLIDALTEWAMADFERRLNDRNQAYGMEQLLRYIGPQSVRGLPALMTKDSKNLDKMSDLVAKIGDKETRDEAGGSLVKIAEYVSSKAWRDDNAPRLQEANRQGGFDPTDDQFQKQLTDFQNETLTRVFASMKKVGGSAVVDYCLKAAADTAIAKEMRATALAALEGQIDRRDEKNIDRLLAIAKSDAPGEVHDQVFRRLREFPRERVVSQLYPLFESSKWTVRRLAAATVLQMSTVKHVDEFMTNLADKATKNFNLPESITYGAYLGNLKEGDAKKALVPFMDRGKPQTRMAAISYWFEYGTKNDIAAVKPYESDRTAVPECDKDAGCDWTCVIGEGDKKETKEIKTVGDFVTFCIEPQMMLNEPKKKEDEKKDAPKDDQKKDEEGGGD